jgi:hypothetical protein
MSFAVEMIAQLGSIQGNRSVRVRSVCGLPQRVCFSTHNAVSNRITLNASP